LRHENTGLALRGLIGKKVKYPYLRANKRSLKFDFLGAIAEKR